MSTEDQMPPYALLACDVFEEELNELIGEPPPWKALATLEMGLHDRPDELRQEVQKKIFELEETSEITHIVLAYALCGNGLAGVHAGRLPLVITRAHDCISILLGDVKKHMAMNREQPGKYFYSPGWIRRYRVPGPDRDTHLKEFYTERYPDDEEMVEDLIEMDKESFAHNNCAAYVDFTDNEKAEAYCRNCASYLGWKFEKHTGDPKLFLDLLRGNWDEERFLVVPPGHRIVLNYEDSIFNTEPVES